MRKLRQMVGELLGGVLLAGCLILGAVAGCVGCSQRAETPPPVVKGCACKPTTSCDCVAVKECACTPTKGCACDPAAACKCKGDCCKGGEGKCGKCCKATPAPAAKPPLSAKRLDALLDHAAAFSGITGVYFGYARANVGICEDDAAGRAMAARLSSAREIINRNAILFDLEFNQDADWYYEVFRQLNRLPVTEWHEYRVWVAGLTNAFDDVCKDRIAVAEGARTTDTPPARMPLLPIPYAERIKLTAREYLKRQRNNPPPSPTMPTCADDDAASLPPADTVIGCVRVQGDLMTLCWAGADGRPREWCGTWGTFAAEMKRREKVSAEAKAKAKTLPAPELTTIAVATLPAFYVLPHVPHWHAPTGTLTRDEVVAEEGTGD